MKITQLNRFVTILVREISWKGNLTTFDIRNYWMSLLMDCDDVADVVDTTKELILHYTGKVFSFPAKKKVVRTFKRPTGLPTTMNEAIALGWSLQRWEGFKRSRKVKQVKRNSYRRRRPVKAQPQNFSYRVKY